MVALQEGLQGLSLKLPLFVLIYPITEKKFTNFELEDFKQVPIVKDIFTYLTFSFPILRILFFNEFSQTTSSVLGN